jgi:hypothetical protein
LILDTVGSVLIDKIPVDSCIDNQGITMTEDQRGIDRPFGTNCDIGAIEKVSALVFKNGFE